MSDTKRCKKYWQIDNIFGTASIRDEPKLQMNHKIWKIICKLVCNQLIEQVQEKLDSSCS